MYLFTKLIVFGFLLSIVKGEINNKIEISATCDEIEQRKAEIEEKYYTYEFRITSTAANYWQSREECLNMGGDLLMHNFGEEGSKYFSQIHNIVESTGMHLWIGANDIGKEGNFRFLNGTKFQPSKDTLYDWGNDNPNNSQGNQDCVHIYMLDNICLNDTDCSKVESVFGDEIQMRGLCEIKRYQNCIV